MSSFKLPYFKLSGTGKDDKFIGVNLENNQIAFHYPLLYHLSADDDSKVQDARKILEAVSLGKRYQEIVRQDHHKSSSDEENDAFHSMSFLIDDYMTFLRYPEKEKIQVKDGKGKINWKQTIKQETYISETGFSYPCLITTEKHRTDNLIASIYRFTVLRSIRILGWLYGIQEDSYLLNSENYQKNEIPMLLQAVKNAKQKTFDNRKRRRLSHMACVLKSALSEETKDDFLSYGTKEFDFSFEAMLRYYLTGDIHVKAEYNPKGFYVIDQQQYEASSLRPDIVFKNDNDLYIFDAKYYSYADNYDHRRLPSSESILKQYSYGEHLQNQFPDCKIHNCFVLPYDKSRNEQDASKVFKYIGYAYGSWNNNDESAIKIYLVDLKHLIHNWTNYNDDVKQELFAAG